jgi:hypothetical protein
MKTPEQLYHEIHKNENISDPRAYAEEMAYNRDIEMSHQQRDNWHQVVLMIEEDWEELTGGMETAELTTYSDADAGL